jgi:hypothetical protein
MGTMGIFSAALGMSCEDCHRSGDSSWRTMQPRARASRWRGAMVTMMATINKQHFGGAAGDHLLLLPPRGPIARKATPNLATLYGAPPPDDPRDEIAAAPGAPAADAVFDKYLTAVGGAARAVALASFTATGTSTGYGPDSEPQTFELAGTGAEPAGGGGAIVRRRPRHGLRRAQRLDRAPTVPVDVLALGGADSDGLRLDAELAFPSRIKQVAANGGRARPGHRRSRSAGGAGHGSGGALVTLYFDTESGCSCARSATSRRRSAACRRRWTTRTTATWPA